MITAAVAHILAMHARLRRADCRDADVRIPAPVSENTAKHPTDSERGATNAPRSYEEWLRDGL